MAADNDKKWMHAALEMAKGGYGRVEPNPMVGCVIVRDDQQVGAGFHQYFGGPHAEVNALREAGELAHGATAYVTLEPCAHVGKTPPCADALIAAGVARVVIACPDPFEKVDGRGIARLAEAGIEMELGVCREEAEELNRPFFKRVRTGFPWVIAKWAMSLDGKIATVTGQSKWISSEFSRALAHQTRGCMDAIMIGSRTARLDDPLLTVRPSGNRVPTRIIVDSLANLGLDSNLVKTAGHVPTMIAVGPDAPADKIRAFVERKVEVWQSSSPARDTRIEELLRELGRRNMTNILIEGGGQLLGACSTLDLIDEIQVFVAPCIIGGDRAPGPVGGCGIESLNERLQFDFVQVKPSGTDCLLVARRKDRLPETPWPLNASELSQRYHGTK